MTDTTPVEQETPWHLWMVGGLGLLWNLFGGFIYYTTQTMSADTLQGFDKATRAYMEAIPTWFHGVWAIAVWGAVLGCLLLLLRKKLAVPVFIVSFLSQLSCVGYAVAAGGYSLPDGTTTMISSAVIFLIQIGLIYYSRRMTAAGVLT